MILCIMSATQVLAVFEKNPPVLKKIISEEVSQFYVTDYVPYVKVELNSAQDKLQYIKQPEQTVIMYVCSQAQGNVDWFLTTLSRDYSASFLANMADQGKTKDMVSKEMKTSFADVDVWLQSIIAYGDYNIIHYVKKKVTDGSVVGIGDVAVRFQVDMGGGWKVENISDDVVFKNWNFVGDSMVITK